MMNRIIPPRTPAPSELTKFKEPYPALGGAELPVGMPVLKSLVGLLLVFEPYGCGKGLSIAAPCNEMPGISGFLVLVHRMKPRRPLKSHLGFNKGSFSCAFPIGTQVALPLGGGCSG